MKDLSIKQTPRVDSPLSREISKPQGQGPQFSEILKGIMPEQMGLQTPTQTSGLKFSNHAVDRMRVRGMSFNQQELGQIQGAVDKAAQKGAQNTLVLTDKSALIVAVKNNTIVTVMDKSQLKENVFTNIDSTVVI